MKAVDVLRLCLSLQYHDHGVDSLLPPPVIIIDQTCSPASLMSLETAHLTVQDQCGVLMLKVFARYEHLVAQQCYQKLLFLRFGRATRNSQTA